MGIRSQLCGLALVLSAPNGVQAQATAGTGGLDGNDAEMSASARAEIPSWRAPFPADGAILIRAPDGIEPMPLVEGPTGVRVEGKLSYLSHADAAYYAWKPYAPFTPGKHVVVLKHPDGEDVDATFMITVVEATDRKPPEITTTPTLSGVLDPLDVACCTTPLRDVLLQLCTPSGEDASVLLEANIETLEPLSKLNQFVFRVRLNSGGSEKGAWAPFSVVAPLQLRAAADEYCFAIDALDIATNEVHAYEDAVRCVPRGDLPVGLQAAPLPVALLASSTCPHPPVGHEEEWCAANRAKCPDDRKCGEYRYACENKPLPSFWRDMLSQYPYKYRNIPLHDPEGPQDCSVSAVQARTTQPPALAVMGCAALLFRTRRRARLRR
jgi:hypothetical protein